MFNLLVFLKQSEISTLPVWPHPKTCDWLTAVLKVLACVNVVTSWPAAGCHTNTTPF